LELAERQGFVSVAIPGMGTGVGGVAPDEAASRMIGEIQTFRAQHLQSVVLVDIDPDMIKAWKAALNQAPPHA
jgi:O-acetyl-ADP-ribose deacetylase (regulator of RNase III)